VFISLSGSSDDIKNQAAKILFEASKSITNSSWNTIESAEAEVSECCNEEYIAIGYIQNNQLAGWIGLRPLYDNFTWELHPIMVKPELQNNKIGI
jgi:choline kinase